MGLGATAGLIYALMEMQNMKAVQEESATALAALQADIGSKASTIDTITTALNGHKSYVILDESNPAYIYCPVGA